MFLFLAFVVSGVVYLMLDTIAVYLACGALLAIPIALALYLTDVSGVNDFMVHSFQYLSGVHDPTHILKSFPGIKPDWKTFVGLLGSFGLLLITLCVGIAAVVGIPVGLLVILAGAVRLVAKRGGSWLRHGIFTLATGLGAVVLAGVVLRLVRYLSLWGNHQRLPTLGQLLGPGLIAAGTLAGWVVLQRLDSRPMRAVVSAPPR